MNFQIGLCHTFHQALKSLVEKQVNNIYDKMKVNNDQNSRTSTYIQKSGSALKGFVTSYRIRCVNKIDPKTFLLDNKSRVIELLRQQDKPVKMKLLLEIVFHKMGVREMVYSYGYFHSDIVIITEATNIEGDYDRLTQNMLEKIDVYQHRG